MMAIKVHHDPLTWPSHTMILAKPHHVPFKLPSLTMLIIKPHHVLLTWSSHTMMILKPHHVLLTRQSHIMMILKPHYGHIATPLNDAPQASSCASHMFGVGLHASPLLQARLERLVIWPLQAPRLCARLHLSGVRGVLLYGPPGTGATA